MLLLQKSATAVRMCSCRLFGGTLASSLRSPIAAETLRAGPQELHSSSAVIRALSRRLNSNIRISVHRQYSVGLSGSSGTRPTNLDGVNRCRIKRRARLFENFVLLPDFDGPVDGPRRHVCPLRPLAAQALRFGGVCSSADPANWSCFWESLSSSHDAAELYLTLCRNGNLKTVSCCGSTTGGGDTGREKFGVHLSAFIISRCTSQTQPQDGTHDCCTT